MERGQLENVLSLPGLFSNAAVNDGQNDDKTRGDMNRILGK